MSATNFSEKSPHSEENADDIPRLESIQSKPDVKRKIDEERGTMSMVIDTFRTRNQTFLDAYRFTTDDNAGGGSSKLTRHELREMRREQKRTEKEMARSKKLLAIKDKPVSKKVNHGLYTPNGFVSTGPYYAGSKIDRLPVKPITGWLLPEKRDQDKGKRTLILDLDETLIHSSFTDMNGDYNFIIYVNTILNKACIITPEQIAEQNIKNTLTKQIFYVKQRPGLVKFLRIVSVAYELVVFTASLQAYADLVLDTIDPELRVQYRLYRQHCTLFNGMRVKDLSRLGRPLSDVILIDNCPDSGGFQPHNQIMIKDFVGDASDRELLRYVGLLEKIREKESIFPIIGRFNAYVQSTE